MIGELFRSFRLQAPAWARRLGLAHEHVAITFRRRRHAAAWAPHLAESRAAILEAAQRCATRRRALVIGAGDGADVPVAELATQFEEVLLTDVVIGPELRRWVRVSRGKVRAQLWDATGALTTLVSEWKSLSPDAVVRLFEDANPGTPPGGEPDLVISANCISQLGVVPLERFPATDAGDVVSARCGAAAAQRHRDWLSGRAGVRVLLGDLARLDIAADGRELRHEAVPGMERLRAPDRAWRWMLAPIPELSRDFHRVHEIGAWIDGPG